MGLDAIVYANGEEICYFRKNFPLFSYVNQNCEYLPCSDDYYTFHTLTLKDVLIAAAKCVVVSDYHVPRLLELARYMESHRDKTYIIHQNW